MSVVKSFAPRYLGILVFLQRFFNFIKEKKKFFFSSVRTNLSLQLFLYIKCDYK